MRVSNLSNLRITQTLLLPASSGGKAERKYLPQNLNRTYSSTQKTILEWAGDPDTPSLPAGHVTATRRATRLGHMQLAEPIPTGPKSKIASFLPTTTMQGQLSRTEAQSITSTQSLASVQTLLKAGLGCITFMR